MPPGDEGSLFIYGANVMRGYQGRGDLTAARIQDGWFDTGDLAIMDEDGFVTVTSRQPPS